MTPYAGIEQVVLLDEQGQATGVEPKATVHHTATPLHLAFSCYVFDAAGALLVTQRALGKRTFPGVWTNSVCGHPSPGEDLADAVRRRARHELGLGLTGLRLVLPRFRYVATMPDGLTENEMCPVYVATTMDPVRPDLTEVEAFAWTPWTEFAHAVLSDDREVSRWCREQVEQLIRLGPSMPTWPARPDDELPPAARPQ